MADSIIVIWIAPTVEGLPALPWVNELGLLDKISGVQLLTCTGDAVVRSDVSRVLKNRAHVVIWSGHGEPRGLFLSDGQTLIKPKWLAARIAGSCRPHVVILATCGSNEGSSGLASLTDEVCRVGVNAIGFSANVEDRPAATFVQEYVDALATARTSVIEAYDIALEAISTSGLRATFTPGIRDLPFNLAEILEQLVASQSRIEARFGLDPVIAQTIAALTRPEGILPLSRGAASPRWHIGGLRNRVE